MVGIISCTHLLSKFDFCESFKKINAAVARICSVFWGCRDTFSFSKVRTALCKVSAGPTGGSWIKSPMLTTAKPQKNSSFNIMCYIPAFMCPNNRGPTFFISSTRSRAMVNACALSLRLFSVVVFGFSRQTSLLWETGIPQKLWIFLPSGKLLAAIPVGAMHPMVN